MFKKFFKLFKSLVSHVLSITLVYIKQECLNITLLLEPRIVLKPQEDKNQTQTQKIRGMLGGKFLLDNTESDNYVKGTLTSLLRYRRPKHLFVLNEPILKEFFRP